MDDKYAKNITTDHEPVVAEMALLGEDRVSKAKLRINKEIFEDAESYNMMNKLMRDLDKKYDKLGPNQARNKWEEFKGKAHAYLIEETKHRRNKSTRERRLHGNIASLECQLRHIQNGKSRPSEERERILNRIKRDLREEVKNFCPARIDRERAGYH